MIVHPFCADPNVLVVLFYEGTIYFSGFCSISAEPLFYTDIF